MTKVRCMPQGKPQEGEEKMLTLNTEQRLETQLDS